MGGEHTRKFQCEYYTVYARPNSCFFCDNCNDIFYDYENGYASPYMWLCDKGNDTEVGMMGKCQDFYEEAEQTEPQILDSWQVKLKAEQTEPQAERERVSNDERRSG